MNGEFQIMAKVFHDNGRPCFPLPAPFAVSFGPLSEHLSLARAHTCTVYCTLVWVCVVNATEGRTFYGFYRGIKRSNRSKLSSSARSLACTIQMCVRILIYIYISYIQLD